MMVYEMLTEAKLRTLKPQDKLYKLTDRDGLYIAVAPSGLITFRYNYRINGRQETLTLGRYGYPDGMSLAQAREKLVGAKEALQKGVSPSRKKTREKRSIALEDSFREWAKLWFEKYQQADSTKDMRLAIYNRDIDRRFGALKMSEITHDDLRALCDSIVERGAPAVAIHTRDIVSAVYRYANERGKNYENPAEKVRPSSIAKFQPRDRALTKDEIRIAYRYLAKVQANPVLKLGIKLLALTMLRKSELSEGVWQEINFTESLWTIPGERMKRRNPHVIYLSRQAIDILVALRTCAGGSKYILPSRYDPDVPISNNTLNRILAQTCETATEAGEYLAHFGPHDLRRTASTILHEAGYNSDWIEKCLAHEQKGVRAVYNKAEYADQRREMMQDWADMIDEWTSEEKKAA
jgi:integrase